MEKNMPTKEMFESYKRVQMSGKYNMITEGSYAAKEANLSMDEYWSVIKNYNALKELYDK